MLAVIVRILFHQRLISLRMLRISVAFLLLLSLGQTGCAPSKSVSAVSSVSYDKQKNVTNFTMYPYGTIAIPGEWRNDGYSKPDKANYFSKDGVTMYASFTQCTNFEFNHDGKKKGKTFIDAYYNWEFDYRKDDLGLKASLIERDTVNNFFVWKLTSHKGSSGKNAYFLFGEKNCRVKRFSVQATKWTEQEKVSFLKKLYLN